MTAPPHRAARRKLALVACLLGGALLAGPATLQATPPAEQQLRLLTWNVGTVNPKDVRLPVRYEAMVVKGITAARPQVVCLQEVADRAQLARLRAAIVAAGGPTYSFTFAASNPERADGRRAAILYTGKALDQEVWVSGSGYQAQALMLEGVTIVNVHGPAGAYKLRQTYYPELARWARTLPQPVVLAGDLNIGPNGGAGMAAVLPWMRKKDKKIYRALKDSFAAATAGLGSTTKYGLCFDHVMISAGTIAAQTKPEVERGWIMDHAPIQVDLRLPRVKERSEQIAQGLLGAVGAVTSAVPAAAAK